MIDHDQPANDKQAYIFIAVTGLVIFFLSAEVPRFADDFCRSIPSFELANLPHLLASEYREWTGRMPTMAASYLIFSTDQGLFWFHVVNGVMISALLLVLWRRLSHLHDIQRMACLFLACTLLWFAPHRLGEVMLWKSGAVGYLWGCVLSLVVCHLLSTHLRLDIRATRKTHPSIVNEAAAALLAVLAAAWLEHLSIAILAAMALVVVWHQRTRGPVPRGGWLILGGWTIGSLILIAAPGNFSRASQIGYVDDLPMRLLHVIATGWDLLSPLLLLVTLYVLVALVFAYHRFRQTGLILFPVFLLSIAVFSLFALAAAPTPAVVGRALFPFEFFVITAAVIITGNLLAARTDTGESWQVPAVHPTVVISGSFCLLITLLDVTHAGLTYHDLNLQHDRRDALVTEWHSRSDAVAPIPLPPLQVRAGLFHDTHSTRDGSRVSGRIYIRDITPDNKHWRNRCFATAHGVPSVILDRSADHL